MSHSSQDFVEKDEHTQRIERVTTNDSYIAPEQHEKLFLSPENAVKGQLRKTFGNPTPVGLAGFLLANTPATIELMGWAGAGGGSGNAAATVGTYFFLGGVLLAAGAIGEWILGNTFPSVVFFTFSGFWMTFGTTIVPSYAAASTYTDPAAFYNSFAWFLVFMMVLCAIYTVCSLRTNACLFIILFFFIPTFILLSASFFAAGQGNLSLSKSCRVGGGAFGFIASVVGWYLFISLLLEAVDFPYSLPVGDLSTHIKGKKDRMKEKREHMV